MAEILDLQWYRETGEIKSPDQVEDELVKAMPDLDEIATDDVPSLPVKSVNELT